MENQITIYIAGDSTAAIKLPDKRPETGWGEAFQSYFKENVKIENRAINGRSTKSFIYEGHLAAIEKSIQPGDYLIIQFGHNDQKLEDPERGTHPYGVYQDNLFQFIQLAYQKSAYPLLLTSVTRRKFEDDSIDIMSVGDFPQAMIQFAEKYQVPVLDIHKITNEFMGKIGNEESKKYYLHVAPGQSENYPEGITDNTHFNEEGAKAVAQLIIKAIKQSELPLKKLLK
ncbi:rhamnogalacturonan acetylesterase [Neobacillus drentensis]|uniref:rhamnogalacturonan acetylesterase n=1 Tax=Neobacillus drentensis TaxID=220684 RepID=UPI002FFDB4D7